MSFRLNSQRLALTYPKCNATKEEAKEVFVRLFPNVQYLIVQEHHKDSDVHLHVLLHKKPRFDIKSETYLDIGKYHGNYKPCTKDWKGWCRYITKEDKNPLTNMNPKDWEEEDKDLVYKNAILATTREEAEDILMKGAPKQYITSFNNVCSFLDYKNVKKPRIWSPDTYDHESFKVPDDALKKITQWGMQIGKQKRCKLMIVIGPPNAGKTSYFRSTLSTYKVNYIRGIWALDAYDDHADVTVLDDLEWRDAFKTENRAIYLGDGECWLTDKYRRKMLKTCHGIPCVIIANWSSYDMLTFHFKNNPDYKDCIIWIEIPEGTKWF